MEIPDIQYARSGDLAIAYQTFGDGPRDIVFVPMFSNLAPAPGRRLPSFAYSGRPISGTCSRRSAYRRWFSIAAPCASLAGRIKDAQTVEIDEANLASGFRDMTREVEVFLSDRPAEPVPDTVLATVLFTDIVASTERASELGDRAWSDLLREHHVAVRREISRFRGQALDTAGDGFFAVFDGPARAIRAAQAIVAEVRELDLEIRAGVHTGECELQDGKVTGIAVNIGARVAGAAGTDEVLVSGTVKDLVAGSGIDFTDRGSRELKGVPGEWRLYAVASSS